MPQVVSPCELGTPEAIGDLHELESNPLFGDLTQIAGKDHHRSTDLPLRCPWISRSGILGALLEVRLQILRRREVDLRVPQLVRELLVEKQKPCPSAGDQPLEQALQLRRKCELATSASLDVPEKLRLGSNLNDTGIKIHVFEE
jgi:hypothetical protein